MSAAQPVGVIVGIWFMAAPAVLGYAGRVASDVQRTIGPVAASAAVIAVWGATRGVRLVNLPLGIALVLAPVIVDHPADAAAAAVVSGLALAGSAPFGGPLKNRMGGGWRSGALGKRPR